MKNRAFLGLNLAVACCAIVGIDIARGNADTAGVGAANDDKLAEIVITAERHAASSQKTSIPIDVETAQDLRQRGVTEASDLSSIVPGLQISMSGPSPSIYIRGVGAKGSNVTSNPAVATSVDGVYIAREAAIAGQFFDLQRIEILKGPQGTLYGRNATGGAINILTNDPVIGKFGGELNAEFGNYAEANVDASVNLPINDRLALRAAGQMIQHAGYLNDGTNDEDQHSGRLKALWLPSDGLSILLSGDYEHLGGKGPSQAIDPKTKGLPAGLSPWTAISDPRLQPLLLQDAASTRASGCTDLNFSDFPTTSHPNGGAVNPAILTALQPGELLPVLGAAGCPVNLLSPFSPSGHFQDINLWGIHAQIDADLDGAKLTVIPAYRRTDIHALKNATGLPILDDQTSNEYTLEARLTGGSDTGFLKQWTFGVYGFREAQNELYIVEAGLANTGFSYETATTTSIAALGQTTLKITDTFRGVLGARFTRDTRSLHGSAGPAYPNVYCSDPATPICNVAPAFGPDGNPLTNQGVGYETFAGTVHFTPISWKAGLEYDLAEESLLYANVSEGYKAGGIVDAATTAPYKTENLRAYEIGSKNRFFNDRLQVNLEGFLWKYTNQQIPFVTFDNAGNLSQLIINAGRATQKGFDLDFTLLATRADTFHLAAEYDKSVYDSFLYKTAVPNSRTTGCKVVNYGFGKGGTVDCSGFSLINAPQWTGTASYDHVISFVGDSSIILHADTEYETSRYGALNFLPQQLIGTSILGNVSATYYDPGHTWSVGVFVRNVANTPTYVSADQEAYATGFITTTIGNPRTFGVQAHLTF